ncbi:DNA -binding domain-containing protein [Sphingomonas quercus]|uniref:DUF2285 domain-containing protein n=1 Tax=Sphingomonas quercus TaxID=2842451 RepID=A0ABS6BJ41_9SPHN|nr:DUF2285 domain-containing protein [Sphingomonas quercus]MBU3077632.1 DUF2285 domain-containing protein [Sphingomonas quercus]
MWSAAVDPRVLTASVVPVSDQESNGALALAPVVRRMRSAGIDHLLIDRGELLRVDLVDHRSLDGPVRLHFDLPDDGWLEDRVAVIRVLRGRSRHGAHVQFARRLLSLSAVDGRDAGASLKEIADHVLGPGDWPGDGEHRKSMIRRMIASGDRMLRAGPCDILADGRRPPRHRRQSDM